jgi:hypothetical protein
MELVSQSVSHNHGIKLNFDSHTRHHSKALQTSSTLFITLQGHDGFMYSIVCIIFLVILQGFCCPDT